VELTTPQKIPILTSEDAYSWEYLLPVAVDDDGDEIFYKFESVGLEQLIIFD